MLHELPKAKGRGQIIHLHARGKPPTMVSARTACRDCKPNAVSLDGNILVLGFSNKANLERMQEEMDDPNSRRQVSQAVTDSFGANYEFQLTMANGSGTTANTAKTAQQSSLIRTALSMGARVLEEIEN